MVLSAVLKSTAEVTTWTQAQWSDNVVTDSFSSAEYSNCSKLLISAIYSSTFCVALVTIIRKDDAR